MDCFLWNLLGKDLGKKCHQAELLLVAGDIVEQDGDFVIVVIGDWD